MKPCIWKTGMVSLLVGVSSIAAAPQEKSPDTDSPAATAIKEQFRFDAAPPPAPARAPKPTVDDTHEMAGDVVKLEQVVVRESKLMAQAIKMLEQKEREEAAKAFTLVAGGRFWEGKLAGQPAEVGLWKWEDLLAGEAGFQDVPALVKLDVVRVQW